jgi:KaiC/GvpD/RAD55 family RecA-like ATPase
MSIPRTLRFGIQSLDKLIGTIRPGVFGIDLLDASGLAEGRGDKRGGKRRANTSSICLTGPDGTGKSIFSLHMAAHYLADCLMALPPEERDESCPKIFYISTDLTYKMAFKGWQHFGLSYPFLRREPLVELKEGRSKQARKSPYVKVNLKPYLPSGRDTESIVHYIEEHKPESRGSLLEATVCFVDLASATAGDDWGFVHRLLSSLEPPKQNMPRHFAVLDAVEGFETLVGELNAFGEPSSRRSRIAQVMRLAANKCHLLYVIEETRDERFPEEFVTDVVIRLRNGVSDRYMRRIIEIEKSRGQSHVRGQHPYVIRDGFGSTTGAQENADDPPVRRWSDEPFEDGDLSKPLALIEDLSAVSAKSPRDATYLRTNVFDQKINAQIDRWASANRIDTQNEELSASVIKAFNRFLNNESTIEKKPGSELEAIYWETLTAEEQARLSKRLFLEDAFPNALRRAYQSYVHVFPSLNYLSREFMSDRYNPRHHAPPNSFAAFGITYLDNMLDGSGEKAERKDAQNKDLEYDTMGLPCGSATALIGDSLTQKSQLGQAFLSRAFYTCERRLSQQIEEFTETVDVRPWRKRFEALKKEHSRRDLVNLADEIADFVEASVINLRVPCTSPKEVAVVLTTQDLNSKMLAEKFFEWLKNTATESTSDQDLGSRDGLDEQSRIADSTPVKRSRGMRRDFRDALAIRVRKLTQHRLKQVKDAKQLDTDALINDLKQDLKNAALEYKLKEYIRDHTICRRFEIHDMPGPVLIHIVQRSIEKAQRIMLGIPDDEYLNASGEKYRQSWRVRVVIDDLNSFRNTYPELRDDPLVLPTLIFGLGREGVTPLIIDTQTSGSPELSLTERFDTSVRELVQNRIYTWRLPFYGENRIAISVIPPISDNHRGVIRELRWETKGRNTSDRALTVDPHFELYMGLEKDRPQPVPLEIRLFAETPSLKRYAESEERILDEIFTPFVTAASKDSPTVVRRTQLEEYSMLRDSCHLQRNTRLDHTTVIQVGEFWWLRQPRGRLAGAFRPEWDYLSANTAMIDGDYRIIANPVEDPFGVFQPKGPWSSPESSGDERRIGRKFKFFDERCGYKFGKIHEAPATGRESVDRVPFTWDFGFLLCNKTAWDAARDEPIEPRATIKNQEAVQQSNMESQLVGHVWDGLFKLPEKPSEQSATTSEAEQAATSRVETPVRWFDFLRAAKIVSEFQGYRTAIVATAFDFTILTPESFSCLVLEMWFSEIYSSVQKYADAEKAARLIGLTQREWRSQEEKCVSLLAMLENERKYKLSDLLKERKDTRKIQGYSLELYKVWLLLLEVLDFSALVGSPGRLNFEFKSRDVNPSAVSARHWYSTASKFMDSLSPEQLEYNWIPLRLPGHFSLRGDWFLAVAGGSRSSRLADHALDLLSSKRANVMRLQEGIGLPTRELNIESHLRTRLVCALDPGKPLANVEYEALRELGAPYYTKHARKQEFFWLWRSRITAYNRHSRIWHKWLNRTVLWWNAWRQRYGSTWTDGFSLYEQIEKMEFGGAGVESLTDIESWKSFHELRNILIDELTDVTVPSP